MDKVDGMQGQMDNVSREMGIIKKESKRNAKDIKHITNEEWFTWTY